MPIAQKSEIKTDQPSSYIGCRVEIPRNHRIRSAHASFTNIVTTGTVTAKLHRMLREGSNFELDSLDNAALDEDSASSVLVHRPFDIAGKEISGPCQYLLALTGSNAADRLNNPTLVIDWIEVEFEDREEAVKEVSR